MPQSYTKQEGSRKAKVKGRMVDVPKLVPDPARFLFNVDTFWYTVDAENYDEVMMEYLQDKLDEGRSVIADNEPALTLPVTLEQYLNPVLFDIGGGQRNTHYSYQLRNYDYAFYFCKRRRDDGSFPIKVQINQYVLWDKRLLGAFLESQMVLMALGFRLGRSKANRIDLCVHSDQFDWTIGDLTSDQFTYPRNIVGDNHPTWFRLDPDTGKFGTVSFGTKNVFSTRIYDKSKEIKDKGKDYFRDIYESKGMNPDKVWNVEFEFHRDILKEFVDPMNGDPQYFDDINNLLSPKGLSLLWKFCTKDKFRHASAFWTQLQKGDGKQFLDTESYMIRARDIDVSLHRETRQIRGRLRKFAINKDFEPGSGMNEAFKLFYELFLDGEVERDEDWEQEVLDQRAKYMDKRINGLLSPEQKAMIELNRKMAEEAAQREADADKKREDDSKKRVIWQNYMVKTGGERDSLAEINRAAEEAAAAWDGLEVPDEVDIGLDL